MKINLRDKKIMVTGGGGFLGSHVVKKLLDRGVPKKNIYVPRSKEIDLRRWENCQKAVAKRDIVIHLAANAGGIGYNINRPGDLFFDNIIMNTHLIEAARQADVQKLLTTGSICAYPKLTPAPFKESYFWNGYPEETNAAYGFAKKMLTVQVQAYKQQYNFNGACVLLANLYGPSDEFNTERSHVIPALMKKIIDAEREGKKYIEVWGTGKPTRDFFYVEDAAEGIVLATEKYHEPEPLNFGSGKETPIGEVVKILTRLMNFNGEIHWIPTEPDGQPRRVFDITTAQKKLGFEANTNLEDGLKKMIKWYRTVYK